MSPSVTRRTFLAQAPLTTLALPWALRAAQPRGDRQPVVTENARGGSAGWRLRNIAARHEIEGYPAETSVRAGGRLALHVRSDTRAYTIEVFRLGWYGGRGGRRVFGPLQLRNGAPHPVPAPAAAGLIACGWPVAHVLEIPREWLTGVYFAKLTNANHAESGVVFVVREPHPTASLLCQLPVTTYQAYNNWGGKSLYDFQSPGGRAFRVAFDRPYSVDALTGDRGFFYCDLQLVRWLESQGYDVAYCTNIDIHRERDLAASYQAYLSCGHDEYWSVEMMDHVERARDSGSHMLFFSADSCHWVIRMEEDEHVAACYKRADLDPATPVTVRFRDPEIARPEVALMGVQNELHCIATTSLGYASSGAPARYQVRRADHPLLRHTGLGVGDGFEGIVGFEWDSIYPGGPAVDVLLQCDDLQATCKYEDATDQIRPAQAVAFARRLGNGLVSRTFSSGTIRWSWGLDEWQFDGEVRRARPSAALKQITANILGWTGCVPASPDRELVIDRELRPSAAPIGR